MLWKLEILVGNNHNEAMMFRMIETITAFVRHSAHMRPRMRLIILSVNLISSSYFKGKEKNMILIFVIVVILVFSFVRVLVELTDIDLSNDI